MSDPQTPHAPSPALTPDLSYALAVLKTTNATALVAIVMCAFINCSAIIGTTAFAGHLVVATSRIALVSRLSDPLTYFVVGAWFAVLAAVCLYLSQLLERLCQPRRLWVCLSYLFASCLLVSLAFFLLGGRKLVALVFAITGSS